MKRSHRLSCFSIAVICLAPPHSSFAQQPGGVPDFDAPVRIEANGKPIDVTTGHAAPYVYDFDGDGTRDLLVGEFGSGTFKGEVHMELSHSWAEGRLRIYRNHGTAKAPVFRDFEYFKGGGKIATVPITCCVSFVPQFVDYDNDGTDDVLSASYPGDMYWWKGTGDGTYGKATRLMREDGKVLIPFKHMAERHWKKWGKTSDVHSTTAELHDMDADGDLDLWIGSRLSGAYTIENVGTRKAPKWSTDCKPVNDSAGKQIGGWSTGGSNLHWADWDGDGTSDLIYGGEDGCVRYCHNSGEENKPVLDPPVEFIPEMDKEYQFSKRTSPSRNESRCKVHVVDWDGDGLNDLLVGDFGSTYKRVQTLTPEQIKEKKAVKAHISSLQKTIGKEAMPLWNPEGELTEAQKKRLAEIDAQFSESYAELRKYDEFKSSSHGWVWLYRQVHKREIDLTKEVLAAEPATQTEEVTIRTLTSHTSVAPGQEFQVAVSFQIANGWHISGNEKGDSYLPTTIKWKLPKGASVKDVQWPKPLPLKQGDFVIPTYEGTITALATIVAPKEAKPKKHLKLAAEVSWQVCTETLCKPGHAKIKTRVAVGPSTVRESTAVDAQ